MILKCQYLKNVSSKDKLEYERMKEKKNFLVMLVSNPVLKPGAIYGRQFLSVILQNYSSYLLHVTWVTWHIHIKQNVSHDPLKCKQCFYIFIVDENVVEKFYLSPTNCACT